MSQDHKKDWAKVIEEAELQEEQAAVAGEAGEQASALEHPDYTALEEKLTLAEQQAHENWEKAVRAQAELANVRTRAERDVANAHKYGVEKLINALLPVIDSLEQAMSMAQDQAMQEGLALTLKLFMDVLTKQEVTQINPEGEAFDPQQHEAMSMQPNPALANNTVMAVFQKGYKLADRVIRPARVIVVKN